MEGPQFRSIVPQQWWFHVIIYSSYFGPKEPPFFLWKQSWVQAQVGTATASAPSWEVTTGQWGRDEGGDTLVQPADQPEQACWSTVDSWGLTPHLRQLLCQDFSLSILLFFVYFRIINKHGNMEIFKNSKVGTYNEFPHTCHPVSTMIYLWPVSFFLYLHPFPSLLIIWK